MKRIIFALALILAAQNVFAEEPTREDLTKKPNDHCSAASGACRTSPVNSNGSGR